MSTTTHFQIDYLLIKRRWRNGIKDVESRGEAEISTNHKPLVAKCAFHLKAKPKAVKNTTYK